MSQQNDFDVVVGVKTLSWLKPLLLKPLNDIRHMQQSSRVISFVLLSNLVQALPLQGCPISPTLSGGKITTNI